MGRILKRSCSPSQSKARLRSAAFRTGVKEAARAEDGQTMIEFAISLGALLTAVFTLMELCMVFYTYSTISECAREGARWAIVRGSTCKTDGTSGAGVSCTATAAMVNSYVTSLKYPNPGGGTMTANTTFSSDGVTFSTTTTGNNDPTDIVRVQVTYTFPIRMPFVPTNALSLSAQSQMYIIQ